MPPSTRQLFEQARGLAAERQAAFLRRHCVDAAQHDLVQRMLQAAGQGDEGLALRDPVQWMQDLAETDPPAAFEPDRHIGPYRVEALLGEGGSARVFRARRRVEGVDQVVALKVLRHGVAAAAARQQFDRERRALVRLVHPGIARFIDAGIGARGEAYIALEYVDGEQLLDHVRRRQLTVRERLQLVVDIARVVAAAHRCLIVHRDLKPANVLVTADGTIKLLDFGVSKLIQPQPGDEHATQTHFRAYTPAYAAPEQRDGGTITTATDVYALGVLLGEVLTGERPTVAAAGATRRGSTAGRPGALGLRHGRMPHGDLHTILQMATAADAEQRYESAAAFADDLQRLLDGRAVLAHPPSRGYRLHKFVVRHSGALAIALAVMLALLTALAMALTQAGIARQEAERARTVTNFLVGLFRAAEDRLPRNQRPSPEQLVAAARDELARNPALDAGTRADIQITLAEVSRLAARYAEAEALLGSAAQGLRDPGDPRIRRIAVARARILQLRGQHAAAVSALAALQPWAPEDTELELAALETEAAAQLSLARPEQARAAARRRLARAQQSGTGPVEPLRATLGLGSVLVAVEDHREGLAVLAPNLARWRELGLPLERDFMNAGVAEANALYGLSRLDDAQARMRQLLELQRAIYREPHDVIATTLRHYATILAGAGRGEEAVQMHRDSIAMLRAVLGERHESVVAGQTALGITLAGLYRLDEAQAAYEAAIAACDGGDAIVCARARNNLGMTHYRQGRHELAQAEIVAALQRYRDIYGAGHFNVAVATSSLANVAMAQGESQEAVRLAADALGIMQALGMEETRDGLLMRNTLAASLWQVGRLSEALREIDRCIDGFDRVQPAQRVRRTMMRVLRAQILQALGRDDEARAGVEDAIALGVPGAELPSRTRALLRELSGRADLYPGLDDPR